MTIELEAKPDISTDPAVMDLIQKWDRSLRRRAICPNCGRPRSGIILRGQTADSAGLCCCGTIDGPQGPEEPGPD